MAGSILGPDWDSTLWLEDGSRDLATWLDDEGSIAGLNDEGSTVAVGGLWWLSLSTPSAHEMRRWTVLQCTVHIVLLFF